MEKLTDKAVATKSLAPVRGGNGSMNTVSYGKSGQASGRPANRTDFLPKSKPKAC